MWILDRTQYQKGAHASRTHTWCKVLQVSQKLQWWLLGWIGTFLWADQLQPILHHGSLTLLSQLRVEVWQWSRPRWTPMDDLGSAVVSTVHMVCGAMLCCRDTSHKCDRAWWRSFTSWANKTPFKLAPGSSWIQDDLQICGHASSEEPSSASLCSPGHWLANFRVVGLMMTMSTVQIGLQADHVQIHQLRVLQCLHACYPPLEWLHKFARVHRQDGCLALAHKLHEVIPAAVHPWTVAECSEDLWEHKHYLPLEGRHLTNESVHPVCHWGNRANSTRHNERMKGTWTTKLDSALVTLWLQSTLGSHDWWSHELDALILLGKLSIL